MTGGMSEGDRRLAEQAMEFAKAGEAEALREALASMEGAIGSKLESDLILTLALVGERPQEAKSLAHSFARDFEVRSGGEILSGDAFWARLEAVVIERAAKRLAGEGAAEAAKRSAGPRL